MATLAASVAAQAAQRFGVRASELKPLDGGHFSSVYEFVRDAQPCVLRILPPHVDYPPQAVRAILAWVEHLSAHDVPVPRLVRSVAGALVESWEHEGEIHTAHAMEKAPGTLAQDLPQARWNETMYHNIGRAVGALHAASARYAPAPGLERPAWDAMATLFTLEREMEPAMQARKRAVLRHIQGLPRDARAYGIIHADMHFANFFVDVARGHAITIFDFDDCCMSWYVMDTATVLFDLAVIYEGADTEDFVARFLEAYLRGYTRQMPFEDAWLRELPHFLKLLEISYYAALAPHYDPQSAEGWVARFMPGRRERILGDVPYLTP